MSTATSPTNGPYIIALDQGTTSSRALRFGFTEHGPQIAAQAQQEFAQHYPQPGWVEHDPMEIWASQLACLCNVLHKDVVALGITNQRETLVVWDRATSRPLHPAIVWQDRRTAAWCAEQKARGVEDLVRAKTGLVLDPYFSASKLVWLLDHVPNARAAAERGELACGTIDTWLIWMLTGGQTHATDVTNASRTLLFNIHTGQWDQDLLKLWNIPASLLPTVKKSADDYGHTLAKFTGHAIPIRGVAGDQQAALFGQGCTHAGEAKNTYGTGCFMLLHTGAEAVYSKHGLLTTRAAQVDETAQFALEGSVFIGGAVVQWLRDGLALVKSAGEIEKLARAVPDSGGVVLVPAFAGLGAPYWDPDARGAVFGLTRGTTSAHLARAALESIALQCVDLVRAMEADIYPTAQQTISPLRVDGGATLNNLLMQMQADLLQATIARPAINETTALGAALLAAHAMGLTTKIPTTAQPQARTTQHHTFIPETNPQAITLRQRWQQAIAATRLFSHPN